MIMHTSVINILRERDGTSKVIIVLYATLDEYEGGG